MKLDIFSFIEKRYFSWESWKLG